MRVRSQSIPETGYEPLSETWFRQPSCIVQGQSCLPQHFQTCNENFNEWKKIWHLWANLYKTCHELNAEAFLAKVRKRSSICLNWSCACKSNRLRSLDPLRRSCHLKNLGQYMKYFLLNGQSVSPSNYISVLFINGLRLVVVRVDLKLVWNLS